MKRRIIFIPLILVALALFAWLVLRSGKPEPVYRGKTLSAWLLNYKVPPTDWNHFEEPAAWGEADTALWNMGTNAYPFLLDMMRADDLPWKLKLISLAQKQHLITIHHVPAAERRGAGAGALSRMTGWSSLTLFPVTLPPKLSQAQADQVVPALIEIYLHARAPDARVSAAYVLRGIGPPARAAVPALLRGATNIADTAIRYESIGALGRIRADSELVVPVIVASLSDTNIHLLDESTTALALLPPDPDSAPLVVSELARLLTQNGTNGFFIVNVQHIPAALANYGAAARPALPVLMNFLKSQPRSSQFLIQPARDAIWKIDPEFAALHESEIGRPMIINVKPNKAGGGR